MLNKTRDESGITTLKLARGSISNSSPPRGGSTPRSRRSIDQGSFPKSPDSSLSPSGLQVLNGVGIVELLEQDERPTFIIDLCNNSNFMPGAPLRAVFANAALRASDALLDTVMGRTDLNSPGTAVTSAFPEFKAWILSFVKDNESLDVCLPSFLFGGFTWTCSTLRKRLRVLSGNLNTLTANASVPSLSLGRAPSGSSFASERVFDSSDGMKDFVSTPLQSVPEANDYFGDVHSHLPDQPGVASTSPKSDVVMPSVEEIRPSARPIFSSSISETVSGLSSDPSLANEAMLAAQSVGLRDPTPNRSNETASFDWTRLANSAALPRHIQFARSIDWASTALGPIDTWNFDLRAMCNLIMGSPHPAAMYWGPEYIAIYNEAYILLAGQKHPDLMGQSYKEAWSEIWENIKDVFTNAWESGQATMKDDDCLFLKRNGYLEESYFSWSIIPLVGEDGSVVGLYNPAFEKTRRKIAERRMLTLREIGERTATAQNIHDFWEQVIMGLEYNEYDVPFAFLYSVSEDADSDLSSVHSGSAASNPQCILEGTLGVPEAHRAAISPLDLRSSDTGFAPYLREALKTDKPVLLTIEDGTLSADLVAGLEWRGFRDPCRAAVSIPTPSTLLDTDLLTRLYVPYTRQPARQSLDSL
jgi:hypothetical protein